MQDRNGSDVFSIRRFTLQEAHSLCTWRYDPPYDVYNCPDWDTVQRENWAMADAEKRDQEFYSLYVHEDFIGFFRLIKRNKALLSSLGLRPDRCGCGYGNQLMSMMKAAAKDRYGSIPIQLEVRQFNQRAIRCYLRAGFVRTDTYERMTPAGAGNFYWMEFREK